MKRLALAVALLIGLAVPAWADFQDGVAAYDRGDYTTALEEFKPLAEQGNAQAQFSLGAMYVFGQGVPQDSVQAYMWIDLAASRYATAPARDLAIELREALAALLTPAQIAEAQRLAGEWKPKKK